MVHCSAVWQHRLQAMQAAFCNSGSLTINGIQADVEQTAEVIQVACHGFVQFLLQIKERTPDAASFRKALQQEILAMQDIDWLKPPMLSRT